MENQPFVPTEYSGKPKFLQTPSTESDWLKTGRWALYFAIYGFVSSGLNALILVYLLFSVIKIMVHAPYMWEMLPGRVLFSFVFLFLILVTSIIFLFLGSRQHLFFSQKIPLALRLRDQYLLTEAWKNMKGAWRIFGIYTLIMLVSNLFLLVLMDYALQSAAYL